MNSCQRTVQWKFLDLKSIYSSRENQRRNIKQIHVNFEY